MNKKSVFVIMLLTFFFGISGFIILFAHNQTTEAKTLTLSEVSKPVVSLASVPGSLSKASASKPVSSAPVKVIIPAIGLNSSVLALGKDKTGNMEVPSGKTTNVGWYKYGTLPGNVGSAVLDAHVFAAFSKLNKLKVGDDIFVMTANNSILHFKVDLAKTYPLNSLSAATLFGQNDAKRLNLITCAGALTADHSTYDHRLIVFAKLIEA